MLIAIPSMGRADRQRTVQAMIAARQPCIVVVPADEVKTYEAALPHYLVSYAGTYAKGIGRVRQRIIDLAASKDMFAAHDGKVLMLDDDLEFFKRRADDPTKLAKATPGNVRDMLKLASKLLDRYAHIGVATREGANRDVSPVIYNTRLLRALGYRADVLKANGVKFDRLPVMEDFDVALQLLRLGYNSAKINKYAQDQPGSNTAGGCSTYRTMEVQAEGAKGLANLHPDYVTVVEKEPLKSGGWSGQPRLDVRIAWKKAYDNAL